MTGRTTETNTGTGDQMSDRVAVGGKVAAAAALAAGKSKTEAATAAGVTPRTVHRWLEDPAFREQVAHRRNELLDEALGALSEAAGEAVATLREALTAPASQARATGARVGAARAILSMLVPLKDVLDHEQRLAEIEAQLKAGDDHDGASY